MSKLKQRPVAMPSPTYPWQFSSIMETSRENINLHHHYRELKKKNEERNVSWQKAQTELDKRAGNGEVIQPLKWECHRKEQEQIVMERERNQLGLERLLYGMKLNGQMLFWIFNQIRNDYECQYISLADYQYYLEAIDGFIKESLDVPFFEEASLIRIVKEITKHSPKNK